MKKYQPSRDLPKLAIKYRTVRACDLSRIISQEKGVVRTSSSIRSWFARHPNEYKKLVSEIKKLLPKKELPEIPTAYAKLVSYFFGTIEIINLETLEKARKELDIIEQQYHKEIWENSKN